MVQIKMSSMVILRVIFNSVSINIMEAFRHWFFQILYNVIYNLIKSPFYVKNKCRYLAKIMI